MSLTQDLNQRALELGVPLSVQMDLTYRCNERCLHCYLDHDDHGELSTGEIKRVLDQLVEAGVFYLCFSGGEVFMRMDFLEILEYARKLLFCVKVKTNAFMINEREAERLACLAIDSVQVSIYSRHSEVHDAITLLPRSLKRSLEGIKRLRAHGIKVVIAHVMMRQNYGHAAGVKALAKELGADYTFDPTITPMMDGNRSILSLNVENRLLEEIFHDPELVGDVNAFCAPPPAVQEEALQALPCSAGHTFCYISPYGDVYPCVQFPLPSGNVRLQPFIEIWRHSPQLAEVRSVRARDLHSCSACAHLGTCTRCPGLAYMEGDMRGPSVQDCEKSMVRTGIPSKHLIKNNWVYTSASQRLVQIEANASALPNR